MGSVSFFFQSYMLTHQRLLEVIDYNPTTGLFLWRKSISAVSAGSIAGCKRPDGYIIIQIDNHQYGAHRVAWFYVHGAWPVDEIDHKNQDKSDNRINNLREVAPLINMHNRKCLSTNKLGIAGVWRDKDKFRAKLIFAGKAYLLGTHDTPEKASAVYEAKKAELLALIE